MITSIYNFLNNLLDGLMKPIAVLSSLGGLASIFISKVLKDQWRIKRSNAASVALSKFRSCIDDIIDITQRKDLYKFPSFPQEISIDREAKVHPERPPRLIEMKVKQLKKELHDSISQLSGKEGKELLNLVSRLESYYPHLSSAIYTGLKADTGCQAAKEQFKPIRHFLDDSHNVLQSLNTEAEIILTPIIELIKK